MFGLIKQSGQAMSGVEEWIATSIEEMINNPRSKLAKPGSTCIIIHEDKYGKGILQKYMLYFNNKWILVEEAADSVVIDPGAELQAIVEQAVAKEMQYGYVKKEDGAIAALDSADTESNLITEEELKYGSLGGGNADSLK